MTVTEHLTTGRIKTVFALAAAWAVGVWMGINYVGMIAIPEPYMLEVGWRSQAESMAVRAAVAGLAATVGWMIVDYMFVVDADSGGESG